MAHEQASQEYFRFCPGEERIKISDAVCKGRRRVSFHRCKSCPFNDDLKEKPPAPVPENVRQLIEDEGRSVEEVFKAYDIRGVYPDPLSVELAWRIGHGSAQFLRSTLTGYDRSDAETNRIVIGRDMRASSPALHEALLEGARCSGTEVIDIGMVDTPQVYFAINYLGTCGGIQVTASHNPEQYNGFKINGQRGRPIDMDTGLKEIKQIAQHMAKHETGVYAPMSELDLTKPYRAFVRGFLLQPRPMKVVVDASNGMAGKWLPIVFDNVDGLEFVGLNMEHEGTFAHAPNPLVESNVEQTCEAVSAHGADFGVCFDGDADRCVFVDEEGDIIRSDLMTAMLARRFLQSYPGAVVVYDLRSSRVVPEEIARLGGQPRRERVGHAFMKKALSENDGCFGGELSGHFYFRDNWYCDSGMLALVHVLNLITEEGKTLKELAAPLKRYALSGERNFVNEEKDVTIDALAKEYGDAEIDYLDGLTVQYHHWWFNVRKSNTEPLLRLNLEADTQDLLDEKLMELSSRLGEPVTG
ncbi:MAG: phosphomannomutase/phosphoglucomutase [Phycisphaerae bacterium]|nr:phosphomannomutase/phosphoglucomutase [Phycisphaerae bacterium]